MRLYKHYSQIPTNNLEKFITEPNLRFSCSTTLNDPLEGIIAFKESDDLKIQKNLLTNAIKTISNKVYICSLNRSPLNPLMWSHYASSHYGFMVEYELCEAKRNIKQVVYKDIPPIVILNKKIMENTLKTNPSNQMSNSVVAKFSQEALEALFVKSKDWQYEHEYRLICVSDYFEKYKKQDNAYLTQQAGNTYFHDRLELSEVKSITFGINTPKEYAKLVKDIIQNHKLEIPTYQAEFLPHSFKLHIPHHPTLEKKAL